MSAPPRGQSVHRIVQPPPFQLRETGSGALQPHCLFPTVHARVPRCSVNGQFVFWDTHRSQKTTGVLAIEEDVMSWASARLNRKYTCTSEKGTIWWGEKKKSISKNGWRGGLSFKTTSQKWVALRFR